jgi:hypothetical protein
MKEVVGLTGRRFAEALAAATGNGVGAGELNAKFLRTEQDRQLEYGNYKLEAAEGEGLRGVLFWEFGKRMAAQLGYHPLDAVVNAEIAIPAIGWLKALDLETRLTQSSQPTEIPSSPALRARPHLQEDGVKPSPEELLTLNPALSRRSRSELQRLIDTIQSLGWRWDPASACFVNETLGISVRTQGLDLFSPENFEQHHREMMAEAQSRPLGYARHVQGMRLWQQWGGIAVVALLADLVFGWLVFPPRTWLISVAALGLAVAFLYRHARRGVLTREAGR